jgi:hypothetical protein
MLLSFVVSLLITCLIPFTESVKNKPSSLREILQRYPARREELLQRNMDQISKRFLSHIQKADENPRELQIQVTAPICTADGSLDFDDDYFQVLYKGDFETTCSCIEGM